MSNGWTPERRERQAVAIRCWKPWRFSTGPGTADGKRRSSRNRYEHRQRLRWGASTKTPDRRARRSCRTFPFAQCRRSSDTEVRMRAGLSFRRRFSATGGGRRLRLRVGAITPAQILLFAPRTGGFVCCDDESPYHRHFARRKTRHGPRAACPATVPPLRRASTPLHC